MSEINQPTPIKPVWPTRSDPHKGRRKPKEGEDESGKESPDKSDRHENGRPKIDDYA
ncbi:MAG: hypothetical protein ABW166_16715 [Sedimenticola sp.]